MTTAPPRRTMSRTRPNCFLASVTLNEDAGWPRLFRNWRLFTLLGRALVVQHLADAGPHEDGVGQLQAGEEIVDVAVLQDRSPAARAHVEAIAQARLVLDEILGVARLARRAGAEEPEQRAARAQHADQLPGQCASRVWIEIVEDVPAQHRVDALVAQREARRHEIRQLIERTLESVAIEVGVQILDVDLAADPLAHERDVRSDHRSQID